MKLSWPHGSGLIGAPTGLEASGCSATTSERRTPLHVNSRSLIVLGECRICKSNRFVSSRGFQDYAFMCISSKEQKHAEKGEELLGAMGSRWMDVY
jgi:hypothetical protein